MFIPHQVLLLLLLAIAIAIACLLAIVIVILKNKNIHDITMRLVSFRFVSFSETF